MRSVNRFLGILDEILLSYLHVEVITIVSELTGEISIRIVFESLVSNSMWFLT